MVGVHLSKLSHDVVIACKAHVRLGSTRPLAYNAVCLSCLQCLCCCGMQMWNICRMPEHPMRLLVRVTNIQQMSWTVQIGLLCACKHILEQEGCFRCNLGTGGFVIWAGGIFLLVVRFFLFFVTRCDMDHREQGTYLKSSPNMLSTAILNGRKNVCSRVLRILKSCLHWPIWRMDLFHGSYVYCSAFLRLFRSAGVRAWHLP